MLTANPIINESSTRRNVKKPVSTARTGGITETDIRRLLASGDLGRTIPDPELREIVKGVQFARWATLKRSLRECDRKLAVKNLPADVWLAISRAKIEYLKQMAQLSQDLDEIAQGSEACGHGKALPHAFAPPRNDRKRDRCPGYRW